jgi:DNA-binding CsgD family transcriptional regulator
MNGNTWYHYYTAKNPNKLTKRQQECLVYLLMGCSNSQVQNKMGLTLRTVRQHIRALFDRFDVNSHTSLMALFIDKSKLEEEITEMMREGEKK